MVGYRSWKETYEKWFGVYMALSTKGIYVFDDKVQNTCDAIIKAAWNDDLDRARTLATDLNAYIQMKASEDSDFQQKMSEYENKARDAVSNFRQMIKNGDVEEQVKQRIKDEAGDVVDGDAD